MMDSLPLFHSWPLYDAPGRLGFAAERGSLAESVAALATAEMGVWSCDLADDRLEWTGAVYRLFGLPEDEAITRDFALSRYVGGSRVAMETLRTHAIGHRRGFTMDALIVRADGDKRWMRLSALPVVVDNKVVRLTGTKRDVTAQYDGPGWQRL